MSLNIELFAMIVSLPSAKMTVGCTAGRCSGASGSTSELCDAAGADAALTSTPWPVTHAMGEPWALSPSPEQVVPWATAIKLTSPKQVQKVTDFNAECMGSFSGGSIALLHRGMTRRSDNSGENAMVLRLRGGRND